MPCVPARARRVALALLATLVSTGCATSTGPPPAAPPSADERALVSARSFLATYVDPDGRVVRRDQGGDTVSEGQAYALLLAVAVDDRPTFARVWTWTQAHLQRPDGALAYLWKGGSVRDPTPAADADTQAAWALTLAGQRFGDGAATAAARRLATAVVGSNTAYTAAGRPLLAAGPWAAGDSHTPATAEPGYWSAPAVQALATLTADTRFRDMSADHRDLLDQLTHGGSTLPPDWASIGGGGPVRAAPAPSGGPGVQCGQDGARALVWAAVDPSSRPLAARWWGLVRVSADEAPLTRTLQGGPLSRDRSPLAAVAAAAAAGSAGDMLARDRLLGLADDLARRFPTYYGSAWGALGRVLLTTNRLVAAG